MVRAPRSGMRHTIASEQLLHVTGSAAFFGGPTYQRLPGSSPIERGDWDTVQRIIGAYFARRRRAVAWPGA